MFLLEERANTSCNTISDSAINYHMAESCGGQAKWGVLSLCVFTYVCCSIQYCMFVCACRHCITTRGEDDLHSELESDIVHMNLPNGGTVCSTCFIRRRRSSIEYYIKVYYDGSSL